MTGGSDVIGKCPLGLGEVDQPERQQRERDDDRDGEQPVGWWSREERPTKGEDETDQRIDRLNECFPGRSRRLKKIGDGAQEEPERDDERQCLPDVPVANVRGREEE